VSRLSSPAFYSARDEAPQQGDNLIGAVSRVVGDDLYTPSRWRPLDETHAVLAPARSVGAATMPALRVAAGRALVMVCTHDCGLDKEFNAAVDALVNSRGAGSLDERAAMEQAEDRSDLDRSFSVSPLVDPDSVQVAGVPVDRGLLMSGRIVGYLPVPELRVRSTIVAPESVVDLTYRATLDRLAYTQRITCVSEAAREQLRFAMARLDVLRTPSLELQLAAAVGQTITAAKVSKRNPLVVELTLADGTTVELLKKPGSPSPGPGTRTRRSVRGAGTAP
jgi:hypothetical protein